MRCDIHRAILDFHSSDSDGAVKPDHGGVLTPRLSEVVVEKCRTWADLSIGPQARADRAGEKECSEYIMMMDWG